MYISISKKVKNLLLGLTEHRLNFVRFSDNIWYLITLDTIYETNPPV